MRIVVLSVFMALVGLSAPVFAQEAEPGFDIVVPETDNIGAPAPAAPLVVQQCPADQMPVHNVAAKPEMFDVPVAPVPEMIQIDTRSSATKSMLSRICADPELPPTMTVYKVGPQQYSIFQPNVVPEPGTFAAMAAGLGGMMICYRRRRR